MAAERFKIVDQNPNDVFPGGGCVCDPRKVSDCKGPFAVFYGNEMDDVRSPHVVLSLECAQAVVRDATRAEDDRRRSAAVSSAPSPPRRRDVPNV
jgi:hypothetical protein